MAGLSGKYVNFEFLMFVFLASFHLGKLAPTFPLSQRAEMNVSTRIASGSSIDYSFRTEMPVDGYSDQSGVEGERDENKFAHDWNPQPPANGAIIFSTPKNTMNSNIRRPPPPEDGLATTNKTKGSVNSSDRLVTNKYGGDPVPNVATIFSYAFTAEPLIKLTPHGPGVLPKNAASTYSIGNANKSGQGTTPAMMARNEKNISPQHDEIYSTEMGNSEDPFLMAVGTETSSTTTSHDEDYEKIIKLGDAEKTDLKSMKKYKGQGSLGVVSLASGKKKYGGVALGHDGVKVTKKKQLIEKNFKDGPLINSAETASTHKSSSGEKIHLDHLVFKETTTFSEDVAEENRIFGKHPDVFSVDGWSKNQSEAAKLLESQRRGTDFLNEKMTSTWDVTEAVAVLDAIRNENEVNRTFEGHLDERLRDTNNISQHDSTGLPDSSRAVPAIEGHLGEEKNLGGEDLRPQIATTELPFRSIITFSVDKNESPELHTQFDMNGTLALPTGNVEGSSEELKSGLRFIFETLSTEPPEFEFSTIEATKGTEKDLYQLIKNESDGIWKLNDSHTIDESILYTFPMKGSTSGNYDEAADGERADLLVTDSPMISYKITNFGEMNTNSSATSILSNTKFFPASPVEPESLPQTFLDSLVSVTKFSTHPTSMTNSNQFSTVKQPEFESPTALQIGKEGASSQIEIEINVSEGTGNASRDLMQFSFRKNNINEYFKQHYANSSDDSQGFRAKTGKAVEFLPSYNEFNNETDVLVVEITDSDNITVSSDRIPGEGVKVHQTKNFEMERLQSLPDYLNSNQKLSSSGESNGEEDDLFVPDLKLEPYEDLIPVAASLSRADNKPDKDSMDRDSDTIFYISNTEVKVVESMPTPNTNFGSSNWLLSSSRENSFSHNDAHHRASKLESQFFPAIYEEDVIIDFPGKNSSKEGKTRHYEEDIILSPLKNTFDPLKTIRNSNMGPHSNSRDSSMPSSSLDDMSVSYVAESFIDAQESPGSVPQSITNQTDKPRAQFSDTEDNRSSEVIIQPAVIPEISIGVPVIGELPPQIELKEIDFVPEASNKNRDEDSIQYGADLISPVAGDAALGAGFDADAGFVLGGRVRGAGLVGTSGGDGDNEVTVTSQIIMQAVDNLQKNELVAELPGDGSDVFRDATSKRVANSTTSETLSNATAFSILDESDGDFSKYLLPQLLSFFVRCRLIP